MKALLKLNRQQDLIAGAVDGPRKHGIWDKKKGEWVHELLPDGKQGPKRAESSNRQPLKPLRDKLEKEFQPGGVIPTDDRTRRYIVRAIS